MDCKIYTVQRWVIEYVISLTALSGLCIASR